MNKNITDYSTSFNAETVASATTAQEIELQKTYSVLFSNVRGLHRKLGEISSLAAINQPAVMMFAETFANDSLPDHSLSIQGYNITSRRDGRDTNNGRCRGLIIYTRHDIKAIPIHFKEFDDATEITGASINFGSNKYPQKVSVCAVYRPPHTPFSNADKGNTKNLLKALDCIKGKTLIMGDFNLPGYDFGSDYSPCRGENAMLDYFKDRFWERLTGLETF